MRRLWGVLVFVSSVVLIAVAPPSPAPSLAPPPLPPVASTPVPGEAPIVLVYPFDVQTGVEPKIGMAIAQILSQEMSAAGGINVPSVPQSVKRADFLSFARSEHADFYIAGYVTPIGDSASVVEQVVSVDSGIILFSQTANVSTVAEVASQALLARSQILAFVGRATQNVEPQTAGTPEPSATNGAQMQIKGISGIVDSVFGKHHSTVAAVATPAAKPDRGVIVAPVIAAGSVSASDLKNATDQLFFSMGRRFKAGLSGITGNVTVTADAICGTARDNTVATGTIAEHTEKHGHLEVTFTLGVYTCFGAQLATQVGKGSSIKTAIENAVAAYAAADPQNS